MIDITFSGAVCPVTDTTGTLVVLCGAGGQLSDTAQRLDEVAGGAVRRALAAEGVTAQKDDSGKRPKSKPDHKIIEILAPSGLVADRVILVCPNKDEKDLRTTDWDTLGGTLYRRLSGKAPVAVVTDACPVPSVAHFLAGVLLRSDRFDRYKTQKSDDDRPHALVAHCSDPQAAEAAFAPLAAVASGVFLTRRLVSEPPNKLYPETFAAEARKLEQLGLTVTVWGEDDLKQRGMGALLAVGQGSVRQSQVVVMTWQGGADDQAPVALVGKGVTFDTGGISLKPAAGMEDMKFDMGGAGVVFGTMKALATRRARANVVGICGLVENMPGGQAQRPGDIVTSSSGQTIEVLNTDAEGRLVLADLLSCVQADYKPQAIVDLATLTGAMIVALGHDYAGIFSNSDDLSSNLTAAGQAVGERVWRMPLDECYDALLKSDAADMKNIGGRAAGAITAAQFLQRFVEPGTPWVHIDIAGTTWSDKDKALSARGATGYGVRLLDRLIADHYET